MAIDAFRSGLAKIGYVEGKNISFEYRWADGNPERLATFAAELVNLKVDVIFCGPGTPTAITAQKASATIPIVFVGAGDADEHVGHDAHRGGHRARALAVQHGRPERLGAEHHRVHGPAHPGQQGGLRDEGRVDAGLDLVGARGPGRAAAARHRQELEGVAELAAPAEVVGREAHDPLGEHLGGPEAGPEGELRQAINFYLQNPQADSAARQIFIQRECTFTDGTAGKRTGKYLLSVINSRGVDR